MSIEERIRAAYTRARRNHSSDIVEEFVPLRCLRAELPEVPRYMLDDYLTRMYERQEVNLIPRSNQHLLTDADRAAALRLGGEDKHLVHVGR